MKVLVAGPWIGEFGWELMEWQARVRALSRSFDYTIVISRGTSKYLYEDFCDKFIEHNLITSNHNCCLADILIGGYKVKIDVDNFIKNLLKKNKIKFKTCHVFLPSIMISDEERRRKRSLSTSYGDKFTFNNKIFKPEYIKFGNKGKKSYDLIIHSRNRTDIRSKENYPIKKFSNIVEKLLSRDGNLKIASIGTKNSSNYIPNTDDLRGVGLKELCTVLRTSRLLIGPSSGPMHLGSICGIEHIVWSPRAPDKMRYGEWWNPHNTSNTYINMRIDNFDNYLLNAVMAKL